MELLERRVLADCLYPAIKTSSEAKTVTRHVKCRRVTVKSATRKNFTIHVGK
jgi:hypothetical protein